MSEIERQAETSTVDVEVKSWFWRSVFLAFLAGSASGALHWEMEASKFMARMYPDLSLHNLGRFVGDVNDLAFYGTILIVFIFAAFVRQLRLSQWIIFGFALMSASLAMSVFVSQIESYILARAFARIGQVIVFASCFGLANSLVEEGRRAKLILTMLIVFIIGRGPALYLKPILFSEIETTGDLNLSLWLGAIILGLISLVAFWFLNRQNWNIRLTIINGSKATKEFKPNPRYVFGIGLYALSAMAFGIIGSFHYFWLAEIPYTTALKNVTAASRQLSMHSTFSILAMIIIGLFVTLSNRLILGILFCGLAGLSLFVLGLLPYAESVVVLITFLLSAIGLGSLELIGLTILCQETKSRQFARSIAFAFAMKLALIAVGAKLAGQLLDDFGPNAPFIFVGLVMSALAIAGLFINRNWSIHRSVEQRSPGYQQQ